MTVNELVAEAYRVACEHGWHDGTPKSALENHMLIVSEVAEALEQVRAGALPFYVAGAAKPEGEAVELADAIIRIADYFGSKGWDLEAVLKAKMSYNATRSYRHDGKKY